MKKSKSRTNLVRDAVIVGLLVYLAVTAHAISLTAGAAHKLLLIQTEMMLGAAQVPQGNPPQDSSLRAAR